MQGRRTEICKPVNIFRSRNHYNRTRVNTIDKFAITRIIRNMSPLAQTRVAVFNLLTEGEVEFWSTEGPGVLVMYFTAPWNGPCKRYRLIFEKVANDYTNKECHFGRIDIDQAGEDIATKYGVNTLPTTLIIKNNKIVAKAVGLIREETLRALVNQYKA